MLTRLRSTWLAGSGAIFLALALTGVAAGATVLATATATGPAPEVATDPLIVDTTSTFEDVDGDGVDDDCDDAVVADAEAATAAALAVDADGDGVISTTEAAHSNRVGGKNCNQGGYVSGIAHDDDCTDSGEAAAPTDAPASGQLAVMEPTPDDDADGPVGDGTEDGSCGEAGDEESDDAETAAPKATDAACVVVAAPTADPTVTGPNAHGAWVSSVARSDAVGGKNCNHGGAVREAARDKAAKQAAKEAAKAEREAAKAEREAAKAERDAAKVERKAGRDAAKADQSTARTKHGKAKGH